MGKTGKTLIFCTEKTTIVLCIPRDPYKRKSSENTGEVCYASRKRGFMIENEISISKITQISIGVENFEKKTTCLEIVLVIGEIVVGGGVILKKNFPSFSHQ